MSTFLSSPYDYVSIEHIGEDDREYFLTSVSY